MQGVTRQRASSCVISAVLSQQEIHIYTSWLDHTIICALQHEVTDGRGITKDINYIIRLSLARFILSI